MARPSWATPLGIVPRARSYSARDFGRVSAYSCSMVFIAHLPWRCDRRDDSTIRLAARRPGEDGAPHTAQMRDVPASALRVPPLPDSALTSVRPPPTLALE